MTLTSSSMMLTVSFVWYHTRPQTLLHSSDVTNGITFILNAWKVGSNKDIINAHTAGHLSRIILVIYHKVVMKTVSWKKTMNKEQ